MNSLLSEPPLIGRQHELEELMRFLDLAVQGKGKTILISGEAGSGKTRLINEFLNLSKDKELAVLSGACFSDVAVPYFPFMESFSAYFSTTLEDEDAIRFKKSGTTAGSEDEEQIEDEKSEIKAWLLGPKQAEKSTKLENLTPQAWKDLAFASVKKALISISAKKPLVLFIDDLHWADSASLSLLHYISRYVSSARVLIIATYRTEELSPDDEGRPHPLVEALRIMRREDLFEDISLSNLDSANVVSLAEKIVGGTLHPELAERLAEESQGNPLFVVESLRMLSEHGSLVLDRGRLRLSIDEVGIPTKIKDIILRRVSQLKPYQKRILDLASAIGDKFDVGLLGAVLGQDSLEVLETLNAIAQSSSLVCSEGNYYRFDHAKIREAIYDQISQPLRKGYHARIAERIEAQNVKGKNLPTNDLAYHYTQAGNMEKAIKYSLAAGQEALERVSNIEAIKYFKYVLQNSANTSEFVKEKNLSLERLGDAYFAHDFYEDAAKTFEQLASSVNGNEKLRAYRKAMDATYKSLNHVRTIELYKKVEEYASSESLEYGRIRYHKARAQGLLGNYHSAVEEMGKLVQIFVDENSLSDAAQAMFGVGMFSYYLGNNEKALINLERSNAILEETKDLASQLQLNSLRTYVFFSYGLFREGLDILEKGVKTAEETGHFRRIASAYSLLSCHLEFTGNFKEAISNMLKAAEYMSKTDSPRLQDIIIPNLARQYAKLGDIQNASQNLEKIKCFTDAETAQENPMALWAQAVFFTTTNQTEKANELFEKILTINGLKAGSRALAATFLVYKKFVIADCAWALSKQGRTEEAKNLTKDIVHELRFQHTNVQADLMVPTRVEVGQNFDYRLDLVNVSKTSGILLRVVALIPPEFEIVNPPSNGILKDGTLEIYEGRMTQFQVVSVKLSLHGKKTGVFNLNPTVIYIDDLKENKTCQPAPTTITVMEASHKAEDSTTAILPGRVKTGFADLDHLLLGGIPTNYAIILSSPSTDERATIINKFLETGANNGEPTFYITAEARNGKALAEKYPSNFFIFVCNPQADALIQNMPNVFKLKGIESLTDIDIALTKIFRTLTSSKVAAKRICVEIISDVLLQHHALITRKWLNALLPTLKSKGFTILGVVDPQMHTPEETQAVLGLFDGEISLYEKESEKGLERFLRIKRLSNQKFSKDEIKL